MSYIAYFSALLSSVWRICVLIFLRILPTSLCKKILPPLWLAYALSVYFSTTPDQPPNEPYLKAEAEKTALSSASGSDTPPDTPPPPKAGSSPLSTLILSLPSPSRTLRALNILVNVLLLLAATEFVFYPLFDDAADVSFTRLGAIYPDSAKISVRYLSSDRNATHNQVQIAWRQISSSYEAPWEDGPIINLTAERDWIETVRLGGLWPSTTYEYSLKNATTVLPYPEKPVRFRTFPDPRLPTGSHFRFVVSSCATPNFPYAPLQGRRIKGFDLLADYLWPTSPTVAPASPAADGPTSTESEAVAGAASGNVSASPVVQSSNPAQSVHSDPSPPTEFMLFLGDFIYADVPFYFGDNQGMYRQFYRRNYQSPSLRKIYERLPMFHTYDDHDIRNNYVGAGDDTKPPFQNASNAFRLYHAEANYDSTADEQAHYYDFRYGDVAFFVLDTRRYRSEPSDDAATRTMLGEKQLLALHDWLGKVNTTTTFKFIVSSVPLTSLWQMDAQIDSWAAYGREKATLLDVLHTIPNVIVLSGDRHEFAAIEFTGPGSSHKVLEVSTSPLSMFWIPFVRTLKMESDERVLHTKLNTSAEAASEEMIVEEVPREKVLKYIAQGNYKWSSLEVDTRDLKHPTVHLEVVIDGHAAYKLTIAGQPVQLQASTALGTFVPQKFRGMLDKIGLSPGRWF